MLHEKFDHTVAWEHVKDIRAADAEPRDDEIGDRMALCRLGLIAIQLDFAPLPDHVFWCHTHGWVGRIDHESIHPIMPPLAILQRFVLHGARHIIRLGHRISHTTPPPGSRGFPWPLPAWRATHLSRRWQGTPPLTR